MSNKRERVEVYRTSVSRCTHGDDVVIFYSDYSYRYVKLHIGHPNSFFKKENDKIYAFHPNSPEHGWLEIDTHNDDNSVKQAHLEFTRCVNDALFAINFHEEVHDELSAPDE